MAALVPSVDTGPTTVSAEMQQTAAPKKIELCCPYCRGTLDRSDDENWRCSACEQRFPVDSGIPDLRTFETHYGSRQRERPAVKMLLDAYPSATFADLVELRFGRTRSLTAELREHYTEYRLQNAVRGTDRLTQTENLLRRVGRVLPATGTALEIGCGSGGMVVALAQRFQAVAGIDVNMEDLILAKKLAEERGLTQVTLACACAEALPFRNDQFDFVQALDVIEHVQWQVKVLTEAHRVLSPRGSFWFTSPNRYHLWGPEPHVMVWGVGFVPRRFQNAYVRMRKGVDYLGKRVMSRFELIKLLGQASITNYAFLDPDPLIDRTRQARSRWGRVLRRAMPWLVTMVNRTMPYFGSELRVVVSK